MASSLIGRAIAGTDSVISRSGVRRETEIWHTLYPTKEAAIADPGLPKLNDAHHNDSSMKVDTIQFGRTSDGDVIPVIQYSTDGSFEILENPRQETNEGFRPLLSSRNFTINIPQYGLHANTINGGTGIDELKTWIAQPREVTQFEEPWILCTYTVSVPALVAGEVANIIKNVGKIHLLGGAAGNLKYCMLPVSSVQESLTKDKLTYYWYHDPGTPFEDITGPDSNQYVTPPLIPGSGGLMRLPYHRVIGLPGINAYDANQIPFPPRFIQRRYAYEELDGINYLQQWQGLPGLS